MLPIQSLHLPPAGLGSGLAWCKRTEAFPEFEQIRCAVSERNAQLKIRNPVLYPAELRRHLLLRPNSILTGVNRQYPNSRVCAAAPPVAGKIQLRPVLCGAV